MYTTMWNIVYKDRHGEVCQVYNKCMTHAAAIRKFKRDYWDWTEILEVTEIW